MHKLQHFPKGLINSSNLISTEWSVSVKGASKKHPRQQDDWQTRQLLELLFRHVMQGGKKMALVFFVSSLWVQDHRHFEVNLQSGIMLMCLHEGCWGFSGWSSVCDVSQWLLHCRETQHWSDQRELQWLRLPEEQRHWQIHRETPLKAHTCQKCDPPCT